MKTIKEWLNDLPEPYKSKALFNFYTYQDKLGIEITSKVSGLPAAINSAFSWADSPEGAKYWGEVSGMNFNNTELFPIW